MKVERELDFFFRADPTSYAQYARSLEMMEAKAEFTKAGLTITACRAKHEFERAVKAQRQLRGGDARCLLG
jgi:hypothetical protein